MEPYTEFIGTLQNSGFWLVEVVWVSTLESLQDCSKTTYRTAAQTSTGA